MFYTSYSSYESFHRACLHNLRRTDRFLKMRSLIICSSMWYSTSTTMSRGHIRVVTQEGLAVSPRIWWFNRIITCSPPCKGYLPRGVYYTHLVSNVSLSLSPCMYMHRQVYTMWSELCARNSYICTCGFVGCWVALLQ